MKSFMGAALLGAVAASESHDFKAMWEQFRLEYNKTYSANEEQERFEIFKVNVVEAEARDKEEPHASFGINQFSDLTDDEFLGYMGHIPELDAEDESIPSLPDAEFADAKIPDSIDWTGKATTPIKSQGTCGACWAFSATEQMESDYILQMGIPESQVNESELSFMQAVECNEEGAHKTAGCMGGNPNEGYKMAMALGMMTDKDYPKPSGSRPFSQAGKAGCQYDKSKVKVRVSSYMNVAKKDEAKMKSYIGSTGPLSACGDSKGWKGYKSGVLKSCSPSGAAHCFQIVGYGKDDGVEYWKVRNSWGKGWGEQGHIRIKMGENLCHINRHPTKVTIKKSDDSIVV
jgi:C1A family cysteine protease